MQTVIRPAGVDDAIKFVWSQPDTLLGTSEKQELTVVLAKETDAVASGYFFAPHPEQWVGTLRKLLASTGNMPVCNQSWPPFHKASEHTHCSSIYGLRRTLLACLFTKVFVFQSGLPASSVA